jgi:hypothetical protein
MERKVQLGGRDPIEVAVVPQRHAYLQNRLGRFFDQLAGMAGSLGDSDEDTSIGSVMAKVFGDQVYEALCVFLPQLAKRMSKHEFAGYASPEALESLDYDEELDNSPTFPQIVDAFQAAVEVNRFDIFKAVLGKLDPTLLTSALNVAAAETTSRLLPSSPSPSDGLGPSTSSTTTDPTSSANAA